MGVYGNIPVGYHTGIPNIGVPLYSLEVKGVSIPISLSYHSTGLRVDERASNVGLGWSCSALNVVGHTIMGGKSDFDSGGYCRGSEMPDFPYFPYLFNLDTPGHAWSNDVLKRITDVEPDVFNYSLPGRSGKFVFDRQAVAHSIPYENIEITHYGESGVREGLVIRDESGNKYSFGFTANSPSNAGIESSYVTQLTQGCGSADGSFKALSGPTGYFLNQIITPYRDTVNFYYRDCTEYYNNPLDLTEYEVAASQGDGGCDNIYPPHNCVSRTTHQTQVLTRIVHGGESVEFDYDEGRLDMTGGLILKRITVRVEGQLVKQFELFHSYFGISSTVTGSTTPGLTAQDDLRLRLDSVRQVGMPAHRFAYNISPHNAFPPVRSYAQDLWGYYNGRETNQTLVVRGGGAGANRDTDSTAVKLGMLRQITYPTGGTSTLTYEANLAMLPERVSNSLETLGSIYVRSANHNDRRWADTTFTIRGMDTGHRRKVFAVFRFSEPTAANGGGSTITGGSSVVTLTDSTGQEYYRAVSGGQTTNITAPVEVLLPNGSYRLHAEAIGGTNGFDSSTDSEYYGSLLVRAHPVIPAGVQLVGGCRIKQISYTGKTSSGRVGVTRYVYTDSVGVPSGYLLNLPVLTSRSQINKVQNRADITCSYHVYLQNSANQVGLISGSVVAYTRVVTLAQTGTGEPAQKTIYSYNAVFDDDQYSNTYPFPPAGSYDWLRGKLIREQYYNFSTAENAYALVREKSYSYRANFSRMAQYSSGQLPFPHEAVIMGYRVATIASGNFTNAGPQNLNAVLPFYYYSASVYLTKTRETLYDEMHRPFTSTTLFAYDDRVLLPTQEKTASAPGDTLVSYSYYPPDSSVIPAHTTNSNLRALRWRQRHHIVNQPLEKAVYRYRVGQPALALKRALTVYQMQQGMALPLRQYASPGGPTVAVAMSYVSVPRDSLVYDASYYPLVTHRRYDEQANIVEQAIARGGVTASYCYGYKQHLLIATAVNSTKQQMAYTSFEPVATGRWQYDSLNVGQHLGTTHFTGNRGYKLDGTTAGAVRSQHLPAGEYELSLWGYGNTTPTISGALQQRYETGGPISVTGWRQHRFRLTVRANATLNLSCGASSTLWIDELRLHPAGAQMTTYTHKPLIGMTSQTGPDGRTIFYEYDALGRLLRVRDEQNRILTEQEYKYAN